MTAVPLLQGTETQTDDLTCWDRFANCLGVGLGHCGKSAKAFQHSDNSRPLMLFHIRTNDSARKDLECINYDYLALG